jgi:hypothetical protein
MQMIPKFLPLRTTYSVALANDINSDLENVTDWLNVNKLQSHPSKAKLMVIGSK